MKWLPAIMTLMVFWGSDALGSEQFLGAPVIPKSNILVQTESRLETEVPVGHDAAVAFYKEALKGQSDIKFRNWKEATYIEDDGRLPWHSITISKGDSEKTMIVIVKDNWTWIIGTLVLRYIGVFAVLMVLFLGMTLAGTIISRSVKKMAEKKDTLKP